MYDQLYRIVSEDTYLESEPDNKGWQRVDGFVVFVVLVEPCEHGNYAPHPVIFVDGLQDFIGDCDGKAGSRGVEPEPDYPAGEGFPALEGADDG